MSFAGVLLSDMARAFNRDRTHVRRWLAKEGFSFTLVRDPASHQLAQALTEADARRAIERRRQLGWRSVAESDLAVQELWPIRSVL